VSALGDGPFARFGRLKTADQKPVARTDELVVEEVGEELLVYDQTNECAHSLGVAAARVWRACDGERSAKALSVELDMDSDTIARALEELEECNLLDNGQPLTGMTRREAALKGAKVGAAAASAPLIYSILAPVPALAATQQYCLSIGCVTGCGDCHQGGCACCGPGGNDNKICTQDCTSTFCNETVITSHCTTSSPSFACNTSDARLKRDVRPLGLDWLE
jgi:hypothetical protein